MSIHGLDEFTQAVCVVEDPATLRLCRTLIIATKAIDTRSTLCALDRIKVGASFSIQNGVQKDELLTEAFGRSHVLGAVADFSGELTIDGTAVFTRNENLLLGELNGGDATRVDALVQLFNDAGIRASGTSTIRASEWSKFAAWAGFVIMSIMTRSETWAFLSNEEAAQTIAAIIREMDALARGQSVELSDDAILPVRTIAQASDEDALEAIRSVAADFERKAPRHKVSALQDIEAGRPLELRETLGYALELGRASGTALPMLNALYPVVSAIGGIMQSGQSQAEARPNG